VLFKKTVDGALTSTIPDSCSLNIYYLGAYGKDEASVLASGLSVNLAAPYYYDLTTSHTENLGQYRAEWTAVIGTQTIKHVQYYEVVRNKTNYANEKNVLERMNDMELPGGVDIGRFLSSAEDDMDIYLAEVYSMPINVRSTTVTARDKRILENIAADIAAGAMIQSFGLAGGESNEPASNMETMARKKLADIRNGKINLESLTKRAIAGRKDASKVGYDFPDVIDNNNDKTGFFDNTDKLGSSNIWRTYP
jgi:hypothetical protein